MVKALVLLYGVFKGLFGFKVPDVDKAWMTVAGSLSIVIDSLDLDRTFYRVLAFAIIFFVVKFTLQIVTSIFDFLAYLPVLKSVNKLLGAVLGFIEHYLLLFIALYVLVLLPIETIQNHRVRIRLLGLA